MGDIDSAAARLSEELSGIVFLPGTAPYDELRISFNGMIDRRPALIARRLSARDVERAVRCALELDTAIPASGDARSAVVSAGSWELQR